MHQYLELLQAVLDAPIRSDRTGTGTSGIFGHQMRFDLQKGFPLLTTKRVFVKGIIEELLWILSGSTNIKPLVDAGVHIWDEWADENGELGPVYGKQWRTWVAPPKDSIGEATYIDQMEELVYNLKSNPFSRRHVVTAWNPADLPWMALPPCHCLFQFYVSEAGFDRRRKYWMAAHPEAQKGRLTNDQVIALNTRMDEAGIPKLALSCQLYQRSADVFLGVPFNIASYALLTHMVAQCVDMIPAEFIWTGGDCHLYLNHREQARVQLDRPTRCLPEVVLNPAVKDLFAFKREDFTITGYDPHDPIAAPVSV